MRNGLLAFFLLALSSAAAGAELLIGTEQLAAALAAGKVRLIDAENTENYRRAHIPGAVNLYFMELEDSEENLKTGRPVFPQLAATRFGALGIARDSEVVVYDNGDGRGASAVWYILRFLGHERVRILDGGFRKWLKEQRPVGQDAPRPVKTTYLPQPGDGWAVKPDRLAQADVLVDARSIAEFSGKENGGARSGGHVPGARSFPWDRLAGDVATYKGAAPMQRMLRQAGITPDKEIVVYCNGGLGRSTHLLAALTLLGYDRVKVYPGSWIEWASDPARPLAR